MSTPSRVTLRDIARVCGVHPSTISLALNNVPSIPLATRERIHGIAANLGYRPNVAARNLALRRTARSETSFLPIAWINQEPRRLHWRSDPTALASFEAARQRAAALGHHLEEIWTREPGMTPLRVAQIVRARGIEGVIFPVDRSYDPALLEANWSDCSLIGLNDHRLGEQIDVVCPDYHANADLALRRLQQRGFTRIGLVQTAQFDAASRGLAHARFLRWQNEAAVRAPIPVCLLPQIENGSVPIASLKVWLNRYRPDAVLCGDYLPDSLEISAIDGVTWIQLRNEPADTDLSLDDRSAEVAAAAVDTVVEKMRRFEKGIRESTRVQLIKGAWRERVAFCRELKQGVA